MVSPSSEEKIKLKNSTYMKDYEK